ncbi:MAG: hypothetical protein GY749_05640 [Desulfobacteraceae bacterium]|nr:hypothetical protein [Desulfobacteraceae bacterium]
MDIILASGRPYTGRKEIQTLSGTYAPIIIDLTERDGPGRFEEIREAVKKGDTSALTELVFLPLYGRKKNLSLSEKCFSLKLISASRAECQKCLWQPHLLWQIK